jgi:1,4-alpha-glucan branching enzyme
VQQRPQVSVWTKGASVIRRKAVEDGVAVTFVVDCDLDGQVSVVGDFNDWTPGAHLLRRRSNGTRSVTATLPAGRRVHFRYLASGGRWFNDPEADGHDGQGSLLEL